MFMYCICIIVHYCFYLLSIVTVVIPYFVVGVFVTFTFTVTVAVVASSIGCQAFYFLGNSFRHCSLLLLINV